MSNEIAIQAAVFLLIGVVVLVAYKYRRKGKLPKVRNPFYYE